MFNTQSKSIKEILPQEEAVKLIGMNVEGKTITNIEANGQIRVMETEKVTDELIEKWKKDFKKTGLRFHEGQLLNQHDSQVLYEKIEKLDI